MCIARTTRCPSPVLLLLWVLTLGPSGCAPAPPGNGAHDPSTADYIPLSSLLEPVAGPLLDSEQAVESRMHVFQSVVRHGGRIRTSRRISDEGWFVLQPDDSSLPLPEAESSKGVLRLTPRQQGEMRFIRAEFSTRQVDLVAIGVESRRPGRLVFAWDRRRPDEPLRLTDQYPIELMAAEGLQEYLVPVRRIPGWRDRVRAFGLLAENLQDEVTIHHIRFVASGFIEVLRREPDQNGAPRGRLELGDESRPIRFAPAGTVLQAQVHVPWGASLDLGYGVYPPARRTAGTGVTFRVEAAVQGQTFQTLVSGSIGSDTGETARWHDRRVALGGYGGKDVVLRFSTESDPEAPGSDADRRQDRFGDHAVWSAPAIVVRDSRLGPDRRNVILLLADTLRPDHLSCYGSPRRTSPHLDRLASQGLLFSMTRGQASWTAASTGSVFTSLYPSRHGAERDREALLSDCLTLAEVLSDAGYHTKGFITNITISALLNFDQGFDSYTYLRPGKRIPYADSGILFSRVFPWLERNADKPFFLYIHTMDPHSPYIVDAPFDRLFDSSGLDDRQFGEAIRAYRSRKLGARQGDDLRFLDTLYDGEIAYGDYHLGLLVAELRRLDLLENTSIIFTSDHGEEFFDHGDWGHGGTLYEELINVPLVVTLPSRPGGRPPNAGRGPHDPVQLVDLFPTVLEILGVELPPAAPRGRIGRSLISKPTGKVPSPLFFAEANKGENLLFSARENRFKFIRRVSPVARDELYDLESDPGEQQNLIDQFPEIAGRLAGRGEAVWRERQALKERVDLDRDTEDRLRTLGYVE